MIEFSSGTWASSCLSLVLSVCNVEKKMHTQFVLSDAWRVLMRFVRNEDVLQIMLYHRLNSVDYFWGFCISWSRYTNAQCIVLTILIQYSDMYFLHTFSFSFYGVVFTSNYTDANLFDVTHRVFILSSLYEQRIKLPILITRLCHAKFSLSFCMSLFWKLLSFFLQNSTKTKKSRNMNVISRKTFIASTSTRFLSKKS